MAAVMQWHLQAKDSLELIWDIAVIIIESGSGKSTISKGSETAIHRHI